MLFQLKMTVYRPEPIQYEEIEVELTKKSGRPLGLNCVPPIEGNGAYIGELVSISTLKMEDEVILELQNCFTKQINQIDLNIVTIVFGIKHGAGDR